MQRPSLIATALRPPPPLRRRSSHSAAASSTLHRNPPSPPQLQHVSTFCRRLSAVLAALKSTAAAKSISHGEQLHALTLKTALGFHVFVLNSLLHVYSKCGAINSTRSLYLSSTYSDTVSSNILLSAYVNSGDLYLARRLFDEMPLKNCVTYTTFIMGLAHSGLPEDVGEGIGVFRLMLCEGVKPNYVTIATLISCFFSCFMEHGRALHTFAVKLGLLHLPLVSTNLVHLYSISSHLKDARAIFDRMAEKNVISWNVMINGYAKAGMVGPARELFDVVPERDAVTWGTMLDGYVRAGTVRQAMAFLVAMARTGLPPNEVMVVDLFSSCTRSSSAMAEGRQLHGITVKTGFDGHQFVQSAVIHFYSTYGNMELAMAQFETCRRDHVACWNALLTGCMKNGMTELARQVFEEIPEKDVVSWSSIISGYTHARRPKEAVVFFRRMVAAGAEPNEATMVSVFSAIAATGSLSDGEWAHEIVCRYPIPDGDNLRAAIIDMYAKCGALTRAVDFFQKVKAGVKTVSPWNAIICGMAVHGEAARALELFTELEGRAVSGGLNGVTFIGVLTACCHVGEVEVGRRCFKRMERVHRVAPGLSHYGCMVDLLGRAGLVAEAEELIEGMPMPADVAVWGSLLAACRIHGEVEIGERAASGLAALDGSHGPGRILLANIYADAGRWDEAGLVRAAMRFHRLQKSPGWSGVSTNC